MACGRSVPYFWEGTTQCRGILTSEFVSGSHEITTIVCLYMPHCFSLHVIPCCLVAQSCLTLGDPMDYQHTRLPCPSPSPGACSNSCPLSQWCHPTFSSSVVPFASSLQSFLAPGSFLLSQFFASGGQSIEASASASVLLMNIQDWFPLGLASLIFLQFKDLSLVFSNTTFQKHQFFGVQSSLWYNVHIHTGYCCCCCWVASVVSGSVRPHRRQPTRLLCPRDSPGKNTRVGCHFLLQCMKGKVKLLSRVRLFATPWTVAYQAPLSMGFSRHIHTWLRAK